METNKLLFTGCPFFFKEKYFGLEERGIIGRVETARDYGAFRWKISLV